MKSSPNRLMISIAMATYNGESFVEKQIESFFKQTRLPDELVICDDCSSDRTYEILKKLESNAPFKIRPVRNERKLGCSVNFNKALSLCEGDLIFLSDQDDVWLPEKIEKMSRLAMRDDYNLLFMNDAMLTDQDLKPVGLTKLQQIISAGGDEHKTFVMGCCMVFKRELLSLSLPIPDDYGAHDTWISRFAQGIGRKKVVHEILQYYRRHEQNVSTAIMNRTKKVKKRHSLFNRLKTLCCDSKGDAVQQLEHHMSMLRKVSDVKELSDSNIKEDLTIFYNYLTKIIEFELKRAKVREMIWPKRIFAVLDMCKNGFYNNFSGPKSAIRDILFD